MTHEIFKSIPHQRVISRNGYFEETFDLYQCGIFANGLHKENIELVELQPQSEYRLHLHKKSFAVVYIISGIGLLQIAENLIAYKPGLRIDISVGVLHGFKTKTSTLFLSIQTPPIMNSATGEIDLHYATGVKYARKF